jgi:hypothetical protein
MERSQAKRTLCQSQMGLLLRAAGEFWRNIQTTKTPSAWTRTKFARRADGVFH